MVTFILGLIFVLLMLWTVTLHKAYQHIPAKELKRRARAGDKLAKALYRPASYGLSLRLWLGFKTIVLATLSFIFLTLALPGWLAFLFIALLLWVAFWWLPHSRLTNFEVRIGAISAPFINFCLRYLHPILERFNRLSHRYSARSSATGLYAADDLIDLLEWQKEQPDSRISGLQIEMAKNALTFGNKLVGDAMLPRREVKTVNINDTIGPILIDELHETGRSCFPVYEGKKDNIIGTIELTNAWAQVKKGGTVKDIAHKKVFYIHEDFTLGQALEAFLKTRHHVLVVVNKFEDFIGILTIEDVLGQIVGQPIADEFDNYEDRKAVAETQAKRKHEAHQKAETEPPDEPDTSQTEEEAVE